MTHTTRAHGRRILSILMAFVLALSLLPTAAFAAEGRQGSGTENDPYIINTADQLAGIKNDLNSVYTSDMV